MGKEKRRDTLIHAIHADGTREEREDPWKRLRDIAKKQLKPVSPELNDPEKIKRE